MLNFDFSEFSQHQFLSSAEFIINEALKYDPGTRQKLTNLEDKKLKLNCSQPDFVAYINIVDGKVSIQNMSETYSDVEINGKFLDLIGLILNGENSVTGSGVSVSGKIGVLQEFRDAFSHLDIDWEDAISEKLGPVIGHNIANIIRFKTNQVRSITAHSLKHLPDILTEELQLLPTNIELETLNNSIDQIKSDANRVLAKVQQIKQKISNN